MGVYKMKLHACPNMSGVQSRMRAQHCVVRLRHVYALEA